MKKTLLIAAAYFAVAAHAETQTQAVQQSAAAKAPVNGERCIGNGVEYNASGHPMRCNSGGVWQYIPEGS